MSDDPGAVDQAVVDAYLLPEDEPTFILRGRDLVAPDTLRAWSDMTERAHGDRAVVVYARILADRMEQWARQYGHRLLTTQDMSRPPGRRYWG